MCIIKGLVRIICLVALALCFIISVSLAETDIRPIKRRALIIACDKFINYPSTAGACKSNAEEIYKLFMYGGLNINTVVREYDNIASESEFSEAIWDAFGDSEEGDINYLYISTHGIKNSKLYDDSAIILSDGTNEGEISSKALAGSFDGVLGTNVIIVDACYSGALINRGVSGGGKTNFFDSDNLKVFTSSGGAEQSWYWTENENSKVSLEGSGFFSASFCQALSYSDCYPADINRDQSITHNELYKYLYKNNASSVVWAYPHEDNTVLFTYDKCGKQSSIMSNLQFNNCFIDSTYNSIDFSFEVNSPLQPVYQIVYFKDGVWNYAGAEYFYDPLSEGENLKPGKYTRKIALKTNTDFSTGYALVNVMAKQDNKLRFIGSGFVAILQDNGLENVNVKTAKIFSPSANQELLILVKHNIPCFISLDVLDMDNNLVYNVVDSELSRPENLNPNGSSFVWSGICKDGSMAHGGEYYIKATLRLLNQSIELYSKSFNIIDR